MSLFNKIFEPILLRLQLISLAVHGDILYGQLPDKRICTGLFPGYVDVQTGLITVPGNLIISAQQLNLFNFFGKQGDTRRKASDS